MKTPENNKAVIGPTFNEMDRNIFKFLPPYSTFIYLVQLQIFFSVYDPWSYDESYFIKI